MNTITLTRNEVADMLGITVDALRKSDNSDKLNERLQEFKFKYVSRIKNGRSFAYILEPIINDEKYTFKDFCKEIKIRKIKEFKFYLLKRISEINNDYHLNTQLDYYYTFNVSRPTLISWQNKLIKNKIIKKDGYCYYKFKDSNTREETSREVYNNYWISKGKQIRYIQDLEKEYENGKINLKQYTKEVLELGMRLGLEGNICLKTLRFVKGENFDRIEKMIRTEMA